MYNANLSLAFMLQTWSNFYSAFRIFRGLTKMC